MRSALILLLALTACSSHDGSKPSADSGGEGGEPDQTQTGSNAGTGGMSQTGGSGSNAAGTNPTDHGPGSSGSSGDPGPATCVPSGKDGLEWADISSPQIKTLGGVDKQSYPGGCAGTVVNRLTGDVFVHIVGFGIWKSDDHGGSWTRVDGQVIDPGGGRNETGWGMQIDQDDPKRMAVFTLDGEAGYTLDGKTWKQWTHAPWGRNWDYGSVDWSSPGAETILGVEHEKTSQAVALSTDAGKSWTELTTFEVPGGVTTSMVGVIDKTTLIGSNGSGIQRSTDLGKTWTKVSDKNPISHVPVRFDGKFYLTSSEGLLVSADGGKTWAVQGKPTPAGMMLQGPFFGADASTLVVGTQSEQNQWGEDSSIYKSSDGGTTWKLVGSAPKTSEQFKFSYSWFGALAWDPLSDSYYTTAMSNPAYRTGCQ